MVDPDPKEPESSRITPLGHEANGICTCWYFDLSNTDRPSFAVAESVAAARTQIQDALREAPAINGGFEPLVLVVGRNLDFKLQDAVQNAGAFVVDLGLPGNSDRTCEDVLRRMDEAMFSERKVKRQPVTPAIAEDLEDYYNPLTENEQEKISQYLRILNGKAPQD